MCEPRLSIAIPHVERPANYLQRTLRSLMKSEPFGDTVIVVCDFSAEPSANLQAVQEEFAPVIDSGQLIIDRFSGERLPLDGLIQNFGDDEQRVKWRSRQVLDVAHMMEQYSRLAAPYYLHLEDDVVAERGCLAAVRRIVEATPPGWFSIKLLELGSCAILFQSADLAQLSAYLRLMYDEMPVDWLIDEHIEFKRKTGHASFVKKGLFDHIGEHSSLTGQIR
jgi:alpha-1,3-mannosylglycoprotein beta-1,4-N-acetylglucosaminyltransferase C